MGLIKAASGAAGGVLADQWKEYFYCEALPADTLAVKGRKKVTKRSSNTKGDENIITTGSVIAVADGQCMLIVDQGKVAEVCAEPGEFVYDASTEPSIFAGSLGESIGRVFRNIGRRFTFGGEAPKDQRVYYFNTKEILDNKYGTASPVPFRVVDQRAGIDMDVGIKCFGTYSYKITNPLLFYTNVCGNVSEDYNRSQLDSQLKTELLTALQPAFAKISELGIRYSALPGHAMELADALNQILTAKWRVQRHCQRRGRKDHQGASADGGLHGPHPGGGPPGDLPGRCHEDGGRQPERRSGHGLYGHEHGGSGRGRQRAEPVPDGPAAGGPGPCPAPGRDFRRRQLEVRLRRGKLRQILRRMRQAPAGSSLEMPPVRHGEQGQVLLRMRRPEAPGCVSVQ